VVVGAGVEDPDNVDDAGRVYVFSGQTGALTRTLASPNKEVDGRFGWSVSGLGDVDGDGCPDMIVGAPHEDPGASPDSAGRAYVFSGATGAVLSVPISPNETSYGGFGVSVSSAGDWDRDGDLDVVVGAPQEYPGGSPYLAGRAYVFDGQTGECWTMCSPNEEYQGAFGFPVSGAGDANGDGRGDVIVGACLEDPGGSPPAAGRAYVFRADITSARDGGIAAPSLLTLRGPFPNPTADGRVRLGIRVLEGGPRHAQLGLYDPTGRCIATALDGAVQGGESLTLNWSPPRTLSPGVYYWRLKAGAQSAQRAMIIAK
jgi:hypothetical protein